MIHVHGRPRRRLAVYVLPAARDRLGGDRAAAVSREGWGERAPHLRFTWPLCAMPSDTVELCIGTAPTHPSRCDQPASLVGQEIVALVYGPQLGGPARAGSHALSRCKAGRFI